MLLGISIVTNEKWQNFGAFEFRNGKALLHLNFLLISEPRLRFQAMATVLHEGRHYTQHYAASSDLAWFEFRAKKWKKNMERYISSAEDPELYRVQTIERDAQKFAISKLNSWQHKFENEKDFWMVFDHLVEAYEENEKNAIAKYGRHYKKRI